MHSWQVASNVLLWCAVLGLGLLVYAVSRQVASLLDRVPPAGALMVNQRLQVGDPAPAVDANDLHGNPRTLGGVWDGVANPKSTLIFFLAPDCAISKALLPVLRSLAKTESLIDIVLASDGGKVWEHRAFVAKHGLEQFPYVLSRSLGEAYGIGKLPYAVLVGEDGRIASLGLVNSREHLESLFEAGARDLPSIQEYMRRKSADAS